jgi:hypothetical protein
VLDVFNRVGSFYRLDHISDLSQQVLCFARDLVSWVNILFLNRRLLIILPAPAPAQEQTHVRIEVVPLEIFI